MKKERFDLVFALGAGCSCSMMLREKGLQLASFPLDWVGTLDLGASADIRSKADIVAGGFRDWFRLANLERAPQFRVAGEMRSFNNKSGVGPRLVITVFARELWFDDGEDENVVELRGALCKPPNLRVTPLGREICDLMLAVRRRYGRSDYLPCIAWGNCARAAARWDVGAAVWLTGRIQSRAYLKTENGETVEKTAYEVSVIHITPEEDT